MYRITPYRRNNVGTRDVFDMFDEFFGDRKPLYVRDFKVDVKDEKDKYIVEAEVPGLAKNDLNIKFENDQLTISINKTEDKEEKEQNYLHKERYEFRSERSMYLQDVDPTKVNATMKDGVLSIELMKLEHKVSSYMIDIK